MEEPRIIHEAEDFLVLDKPAGWVVNDATTVAGPTLQQWLRENPQTHKFTNYQLRDDANKRQGIVHRLDKETSGVLVVAKTETMLHELQLQFKDRLTKKTYIALVHGKLEPREGSMALPLGRSVRDRQKFTVRINGKMAETAWAVESYHEYEEEVFSLVSLFPKTGRTHQLRVHLAHLKHPMVADPAYLPAKKLVADLVWCPRLFLHAKELCFTYKGSQVCFETELPEDLQATLKQLYVFV